MTRRNPGPWRGATLQALREAASLTQYGLAKAMRPFSGCERVSPTHVARWEAGNVPSAVALAAMARVLRVSMERLCEAATPAPTVEVPRDDLLGRP